MSTSIDTDPPMTLQTLQRLETESLATQGHRELIRFFCLQVIPLLSKIFRAGSSMGRFKISI